MLGAIAVFAGLHQNKAAAVSFGAVLMVVPTAIYFQLRRALRFVVLRQTAPEAAFEGDTVEVAVSLTNESRLPLFYPRFSEIFGPEFATQKDLLFPDRIEPGEVVVRRYEGHCEGPRGIYDFGPTALRITDPFGWFEVRRQFSSQFRIKIYPSIHDIRMRDEVGDCLRQFRHAESMQGPGSSNEFWSVRDYRHGDPRGRIHWRLTARRGTPIVRETTRQTAGDFAVILDPCRRAVTGRGRYSSFEVATRLAASLAADALGKGRRVRLMAGQESSHQVELAAGRQHLSRILDSLVELRFGSETQLPQALTEALPTFRLGMTIVVMVNPYLFEDPSLLAPLENLVRRGCILIAVLFPSRNEDEPTDPERLGRCRARLRRAGIETRMIGPRWFERRPGREVAS